LSLGTRISNYYFKKEEFFLRHKFYDSNLLSCFFGLLSNIIVVVGKLYIDQTNIATVEKHYFNYLGILWIRFRLLLGLSFWAKYSYSYIF
jgi:hypothetical protein